MQENKTTMIAALKSAFLDQGHIVGSDFEERAAQLPLSRLAIEVSLAKAGI